MLVTLDPGIRGCGLALFDARGQLLRATYVRNPTRAGMDGQAIHTMGRALLSRLATWGVSAANAHEYEAIGELPQIYAFGRGKGDPNDLIPLAAVVGGLLTAHSWGSTTVYKPRVWKGTIPGDAMVARISATGAGALLSPAEHARTEPPCASLAHNMWDAVGIGLSRLGRLTVRKYPGASPG